jgi:3-phenylpropionate/trans-cinnamate dioxygenase ferredoxin reductase component
MTQPRNIIIIGAGHGGVQTAASLRDEGFDGAISLIDAQTALPYQRPPLSKAFLKGHATSESIMLRAAQFYAERKIDLHLGHKVERIDRQRRLVMLPDGKSMPYDHLVLATGARARPLSIPGRALGNVFSLRDLRDAQSIRNAISPGRSIVVVGAGFIGLEFAAVARSLGASVTVVEAQARVMARAVSAPISATFAAMHRALGTNIDLETGVSAFHGHHGMVRRVEFSDGSELPADLVVVGIGVLAKDRLAADAGLSLANGIIVDHQLRTQDRNISAVGDNNSHPNPFHEGMLRLESVQNAVDQAKCIARNLTGKTEAYRAVPWFWSDQGDLKLQIAGVAKTITQHVVRGDPASNAYSVFGFDGDRLKTVESINRPADHMVARRLIGESLPISPTQAADLAFDIKALVGGGAR